MRPRSGSDGAFNDDRSPLNHTSIGRITPRFINRTLEYAGRRGSPGSPHREPRPPRRRRRFCGEVDHLDRLWEPPSGDSVAHAAELKQNPKKKARRVSRAGRESEIMRIPKGSHIIETGSLHGNKLTYTFENKDISYEITPRTLEQLENIKKKVFDSFRESQAAN